MLRHSIVAFGSGLAAASNPGLQVAVSPGVVPAHGTLTVTVKNSDGTPYSGALDYDMLSCPIGVIDNSACSATNGPWGDYVVANGSVSINIENATGGGLQFIDGMYIVRYRPHGSSDRYSNQVGYVIDRSARPVAENDANNSGEYALPKPVEGAYTVFRDVGPDDTINGYTKVEFEKGACEGRGVIQRFTKSSPTAYWGPGTSTNDSSIRTLRWCIGQSPTNLANFKAFSSEVYAYNRTNVKSSSLSNASYPDLQLGNLSRLGSNQPATVQMQLSTLPRLQSSGQQPGAGSQAQQILTPLGATPLFYTLAPVNLFPETLTTSFVPVIDRLIDYDPARETLNNWHVEVRASALGGIYEVRYVEWALGIATLASNASRVSTPSSSVSDWNLTYRWNVLEDWDWNADGTLNRITQQGTTHAFTRVESGDFPVDCWTKPTGCEHIVLHRLDKVLSYTPDNRPLNVQFVDNFGSRTALLTTRPNQPFRLSVRTADGQPFDGFLQLAPIAGTTLAWVDQGNYPIYVSSGFVELRSSAFASQPLTISSFQARQQLLNEGIASDIVLAAPEQPTNTTQPFSNEIYVLRTDS